MEKNKKDIKKEIQKYIKLPYTIKLIPEEDGTYYVTIDELPGCASMGDTVEEAMKMIKEAMEGWLESSIDRGLEIPLPEVMREHSGKFLVRVSMSLHRKLAETAKKEGVSLNQFVVSLLSEELALKDIEIKLDEIVTSMKKKYPEPKEIVSSTILKWEEDRDQRGNYVQ